MFNSIMGILGEKQADGVYVATGGVEWDIAMPESDIAALPEAGAEARVYTWLYHREDAMRLVGFSSAERRATFLELLKVEGIGVKGALKIMGGIAQAELEAALETEDVARLSAVPGLGKKTAQKMILALKGKLARADNTSAAPAPYRELAEALTGMGYDKKAAIDALSKAAATVDAAPAGKPLSAKQKEEQIFREAVLLLSR
jgi:Holliday junction DNA helicase RuvA